MNSYFAISVKNELGLRQVDIQIRNCREEDLVAVKKIEDTSFEDPYPYELFLALLQDFPDGFRVAVSEDDEIVGYCILSRSKDIRVLIISSVAVDPDFRRLAVGSKLLADAIDIATESSPRSHANKIILQVAVDNSAAQDLYRRFGFRDAGRIRNYYGRGRDGLQMELALTRSTKN